MGSQGVKGYTYRVPGSQGVGLEGSRSRGSRSRPRGSRGSRGKPRGSQRYMPQKIEAIDMVEVTMIAVTMIEVTMIEVTMVAVTMVEVHSNSSIKQEQVIVQYDGI